MRIYCLHISEIRGLDGGAYLTPERRQMVCRYKNYGDKARCAAAGLLLSAYVCGRPGAAFYTNACGKPYLKDGCYFNISHSGEYACLAVSNAEVGVDIEKVAEWPPEVAQSCFTAREYEWLLRQPDKPDAFFKLWTGKESVMKSLGLGLNLAPQSFEILPVQNGAHTVLGRVWHVYWFAVDGHTVCAASESIQSQPSLKRVNRDELLCRLNAARQT